MWRKIAILTCLGFACPEGAVAAHPSPLQETACTQDRRKLLESLEEGRFEAAASALAAWERSGASPGLQAMRRIESLKLDELETLRRALTGSASAGTSKRTAALLDAQIARQRGDDVRVLEILTPLTADRGFKGLALDALGRAGLRLCRRGQAAGLPPLETVHRSWRGASWALGNLSLGLRLLGRYEDAAVRYEELLIATSRAAWALNDAALVEVARGDRARAIELLLEGVQRGGDGVDNCAGNAALLLLQRRSRGDVVKARALLQNIVRRDETRSRARFWLERLIRRRKRLPDGVRVDAIRALGIGARPREARRELASRGAHARARPRRPAAPQAAIVSSANGS